MALESRGFAKLDSGIVESSLWVKDHDVLRVWIFMLARADSYGLVRGSIPSVAHQCFVTVDRLAEILEELSAPDPHSRTNDDDGRRLKSVEGGWVVLNYVLYRELVQRKTGSHAERQARYRERLKERDARSVTRDARPVTSDTEAEADNRGKEKDIGQQADRPRFEEFWQAYPRKVKRRQAEDLWKRRKLDRVADRIIADVVARSKRDPQWLEATKLIPHPTSYLNAERWTDEWDEPQTVEDEWTRACRLAKERGLEPFRGAPHETPAQFMARVGA